MQDLKEQFIDAPEIAKYICKTLATVHNYRKTNILPFPVFKLNTIYLWNRAEVIQWMSDNGYLKPANDEFYNIEEAKK